jgi:hypothetical protein
VGTLEARWGYRGWVRQGQAFVKFEEDGTGHFQFGYVSGYMDGRPVRRT